MIFLLISILAGILTVLAPCILPLLPIIIGSSEAQDRSISKRSLVVIGSLSISVVIFTLLLKASTLLFYIPQTFWNVFSGSIIILVGLAIVFPLIWSRISFVQKIHDLGNRVMGAGFQKKTYSGDVLVGLALGPVFTTCSPTYLFIIATILPVGFLVGFVYLLGFTFGLAISLLLVAFFGGQLVKKITSHMGAANRVKQVFGILIILVGVAILTGYDKKIETAILDAGYGATINFEESLIERFAPRKIREIELFTRRSNMNTEKYETITLAGGCFWCTEATFQEQPGVIDAISGYTGGSAQDASYLKVTKGSTLHREAVQITYDPKIISIEEILKIYWSHIDPTDTKGQFADKGYQYTTAIYFYDELQRDAALDSKKRLEESGLFTESVATEILPIDNFFRAEEYHQDYYKKASAHYEQYKKGSGRVGFIEETWAKDAAIAFLEAEHSSSMNKEIYVDYEYTDKQIKELQKKLDPLAYSVLAKNSTEPAFNNKYWDNEGEGIYVDAVTKRPLFSSTHKYDSGTGWPSFWRAIDDDSVTLHEDGFLWFSRTEVRSAGGHLGHVFADGPKEFGGLRFCINSAALVFIPKEEMQNRGYEDYLYFFDL